MRLTLTVATKATDRAFFRVVPTVFPVEPEGLASMEPEPHKGISAPVLSI